MKNNKGMTLLELLAVMTILGILSPLIGKMFLHLNVSIAKAEKLQRELASPQPSSSPNPAVSPGADQRTYLPVPGQCELIKGASNSSVQWYGKRFDSETVQFYKNSNNCTTGYIGTLTAQTNPTYDDDTTNTFWNVSSSGTTLRVLVRKLNLPL